MKKCSDCSEVKSLDEFHNDKTKKDGKRNQCKECKKEYDKNDYENGGGREKLGCHSMYENKSSAQYIGIVINERLIKHLYPDAVMNNYGFPGYDFTCQKGKKVDAKASAIHIRQNVNSRVVNWQFAIRRNKIPDFFLCVAYNNIDNPTPLHIWMIPAEEINDQSGIKISATTIHKWNRWKIDIDKAQACCTAMKEKKLKR